MIVPSLYQEAIRWLQSNSVQEWLSILVQKTSLPTSFTCWNLMCIVSCIQLKYEFTQLGERSLFVTAIVSTISYAYPDISITRD